MKGVNNMNNWTVYMHLNKVNKKYYFGITKQALKRRFRNGEGYTHCPHFYHAIQKYGWENFDHIVIKENITESQAIWWEKYLIKKYDATNPDKGYNISTGGDVVVGSEKISQLNKQRWKQGVYDNSFGLEKSTEYLTYGNKNYYLINRINDVFYMFLLLCLKLFLHLV